MQNPLVSVIIPVYNVERFLPQCLDSVVHQTYKNIEIILINDGSPDGSDAICKEYKLNYSHIQYYIRKNSGLSATRNYGLKYAKGDYVFFLDSDDYLELDCIADMVDVAKTGKLAITGFKIEDMSQGTVYTPKQHSGSYDNLYTYLLDFHNYFATKFNFAWGKLYRRDIIEEHHLLFVEGLSLVEDVLFNIEYYRYCRNGVIMLESCGYYYRQSDSSTLSKRFNPKMFEWREQGCCALRDFLKTNNAMTTQNRTHFYSDVMGNLFYSTGLLALQSAESFSAKKDLIRKYASTELAIETYAYAKPKGFRSRLMKFFLKHRMVNTYIFANQLIKTIKNLLR